MDAFSLKDHEHDLVVQLTQDDPDGPPMVTFVDQSTGQKVTMAADVFYRVGLAVDTLLEATEENGIDEDLDDETPHLPKSVLN